ncbi:2Fe-2S iron-sulfur cluster-binding protein [Spirulina subsalsa]|uniref:2Fe-2S iron-sulfur cluster-binding protein n=1 Tax=Spirulina subsalsa TaxID=54311 RepID=UPI0002D4F0E9|nr:2Fe-2S iron-sulfur cluster-binding protein [Spirulina subsalsa]
MTESYTVEITHQGTTYTLKAPAHQTILQTALDEGIELPNSCNAGVCTTCGAKILSGEVDQSDAMGVSPDLQKEGYALLCVAYPRSDLKIISDQEEEIYKRQFGAG